MSAVSDRFVEVGGLTLPAEVVLLALDLESRGFCLTPAAGGDLLVHPFSALTAEDTRQLRRWKTHLLALIAREVPYV